MIKIGKNTWVNPNNINFIRPAGDNRKWIVTFNFGNMTVDEMEFRELLQELTAPEPVVTTTDKSMVFGGVAGPAGMDGKYGTAKFG